MKTNRERIEAVRAAYEATREAKTADTVQALVDALGVHEAAAAVATVVNAVSLEDGRISDNNRNWTKYLDADIPTNSELRAQGVYGVDSWMHSAHVDNLADAMRKYLRENPAEEEAQEAEEEENAITVKAVEEYRKEHGEKAALDLLQLLGPDRFSGDFKTAVVNLREIVDRQTVRDKQREQAQRKQEETDRENFEHCRSIAQELEQLAEGVLYKCPHCGEVYSIEEAEETEDGHTCPACSEEIEENEAEQLTAWEYFEGVLDVEYLIGSDGSYRACRLMVACGGPNIYVDTASAAVELYWWGDTAKACFSRSTADAIDADFEELYTCSR